MQTPSAEVKSKIVGILVEYNYEDLEVQYPRLRLKEAGHEVWLIGESS